MPGTPCDLTALEDTLLRLAQLADHIPEIAELDLNPLIAHPNGCLAVDARVRLEPRPHDDPYLRRLK